MVVAVVATRVATAEANTAPIVAVFDVEDTRAASDRLSQRSLDNLTAYLTTLVPQSCVFKVVPNAQLRAVLQEEKAGSYEACVDEACQIEIGKAVAAEKTLATKIIRVGKRCVVTTQLYDLREEAKRRAVEPVHTRAVAPKTP